MAFHPQVPLRHVSQFRGVLDVGALVVLFKRITSALAKSMVGIVSVFLVIGDIVIMKVMLATVTERTHEIGLRKPVGARHTDILLQFLVESALMSAIGGALETGISLALNALMPLLPSPVPA